MSSWITFTSISTMQICKYSSWFKFRIRIILKRILQKMLNMTAHLRIWPLADDIMVFSRTKWVLSGTRTITVNHRCADVLTQVRQIANLNFRLLTNVLTHATHKKRQITLSLLSGFRMEQRSDSQELLPNTQSERCVGETVRHFYRFPNWPKANQQTHPRKAAKASTRDAAACSRPPANVRYRTLGVVDDDKQRNALLIFSSDAIAPFNAAAGRIASHRLAKVMTSSIRCVWFTPVANARERYSTLVSESFSAIQWNNFRVPTKKSVWN